MMEYIKLTYYLHLSRSWFRQTREAVSLSAMMFAVFVFLRPINQSICYQF